MWRERVYGWLTGLGLLACAAGLVLYPQESVEAAGEGLRLCLEVIVPSLLPFFVVSGLTVELGLAARLGRFLEPVMRRLFNVSGPCAAAFLLGFIGGYPVGARTAIALYREGACTREEAERLLSFCNNSGPAFILGVVGAGVFSDDRVGLLLYLAHTLASVLTGLCFRFWKRGAASTRLPAARRAERARPPFAGAFTGAVKSAFSSALSISGFVVFFTVLIRLLFLTGLLPLLARGAAALLGPLGLTEKAAEQLLTGVVELCSGVWSLKGAASSLTAGAAMAAFMLGWAGLSIHSQTLSFLADSGLSSGTYFLGKLLHGLFSAALAGLLFRLVPFREEAAAYLARQVTGLAEGRLGGVLPVSLLAAGAFLLLLFLFDRFTKKRCGNAGADDVQ